MGSQRTQVATGGRLPIAVERTGSVRSRRRKCRVVGEGRLVVSSSQLAARRQAEVRHSIPRPNRSRGDCVFNRIGRRRAPPAGPPQAAQHSGRGVEGACGCAVVGPPNEGFSR